MELNTMFSPVRLGPVEVKNRFAVPPMGNNFANTDGSLSGRSLAYYEARAKGGFGFIIVEATVAERHAKGGPRKPCLFEDGPIESFRAVAEACHRHGAKICVELQHAGPEGNAAAAGYPIHAASAIPSRCGGDVPKAMTKAEIYRLIDAFGDAAYRAKQAGFDAVEIHCAHGYLLHSFISPRTNKRQDEFGGCLENRLRLPLMVIRRIRERVGEDMAILARINARDDITGGLDEHDSAVIAAWLEKAGVDAIDVSRAVHLRDEHMWAPTAVHAGFNAAYIEEIKRAVQIPVIAVGRFSDPYYAELMVAQGRADIVAFGRQSLADPELPNHYHAKRGQEVIPCIACLQGCVPNMYKGQPIKCLANPVLGREAELKPAEAEKKVLVVGGGVGGMVFSWIAAYRGHRVILCEAGDKLGGQLRVGSIPPGKGDLNTLICAYRQKCEQYGVEIRLNTPMNAEKIRAEEADVVIIATGAKPLRLPIPGLEDSGVLDAVDVLDGAACCGEKVLVVGGGLVGCETADFLSELGHKVTVVELRDEVGVDMASEHRKICMANFAEAGVHCVTSAKVTQFHEDGVSYSNGVEEEQELRGFDSVVLAMGSRSYNPFTAADALAPEIIILGDAVKARRALDATQEAFEAAIQI